MCHWEQCAYLSWQRQPNNGGDDAEYDANNDRDHPHAMGPRNIDAVIEIRISHWSRH
jgi:hypothetical protein